MAMTRLKKRPVALVILDGFGYSDRSVGNAIRQASTPFLDQYLRKYQHTLIEGSGSRVGLPGNWMGNSEVGHLNIGAGRVVPLDIMRIDDAIATGRFAENPVLQAAIDAGKSTALHFIGLVSDGGVHSSIDHLYALLEMAAARGVKRIYIHALTDGRDTPQTSARNFIGDLGARLRSLGIGKLATLCGRYYAMDRDHRWERIERAYRLIAFGEGRHHYDPLAALDESYEFGVTDEFIEPTVLVDENDEPIAHVRGGESVVFFNFRADRARQLTRAFSGLNFDGFARELIPELHFATFTQYDRAFNTPIVFPPVTLRHTLAEVFAAHEITNLRIAETEKYAHVTYFFNGGVEREYPGEKRILVPSPPVTTYDQQPKLSAFAIADHVCRALDEGLTDVTIINFANADMVGHTGNLSAAISAIEALDACLGRVIGEIERLNGAAIITSDHGNAEQMIDPQTGKPHTAHTNNPVPFILCDADYRGQLRPDGALEDIAPTLLDLLGIEPPTEMTGRSLLRPSASGS
jgi:2,3-bisphosphoglycerate-independent phosphoglycerate mutase